MQYTVSACTLYSQYTWDLQLVSAIQRQASLVAHDNTHVTLIWIQEILQLYECET